MTQELGKITPPKELSVNGQVHGNEIPPKDRGRFTFEEFSQNPEYQEVTKSFIRQTLQTFLQSMVVLEVAPGTGMGTDEIVKTLNGRKAFVVGIDNNPASLKIARQKVKSQGETVVNFIYGDGRYLPLPSASVDITYFLNAIHEIPSKESKMMVLKSISNTLKPGGKLFINSAFTKELYEGLGRAEMLKWGLWKKKSMSKLKRERNKNKVFEIYSTEEYCAMMREAGLQINKETDTKSVRVDLSVASLKAISRYDTFIEGFFIDMEGTEDFPIEEKSRRMIEVLDEMEKEFNEDTKNEGKPFTMARNWVELEATKPI